MTIKDLKNAIKDLDDTVEIAYKSSSFISPDIAKLILLNTILQYDKDSNTFILAEVTKNYLLPEDLYKNKLVLLTKEEYDEISTSNVARDTGIHGETMVSE